MSVFEVRLSLLKGPSITLVIPGMVTHTFNPNTWKTEVDLCEFYVVSFGPTRVT